MIERLAKYFLLGTSQSQPDETMLQDLKALGVNVKQPTHKILLDAAALFSQLEKTKIPIPISQVSTTPTPTFDTQLNSLPYSAITLFVEMIDGEFKAALPEAIALCQTHGYEIPPASLPNFIITQIDQQIPFEQYKKIIGARGFWLMKQHPIWKKHVHEIDIKLWTSKNSQDKSTYFKHLYKTDPKKARNLLAQDWKGLNEKQSLAIIDSILHQITFEDEMMFNELLVKSHSLPVLQKISKALSKIYNSRYSQKLISITNKYLYLDENLYLKLDIDSLSQTLGQNTTLYLPINTIKLFRSLSHSLIYEAIVRIAPQHWLERPDRSAFEICQSFAHSDFPSLTWPALQNAILFHEDIEFAKAYLAYIIEENPSGINFKTEVQPFLQQLTNKSINETLFHLLGIEPLSDNESRVFKWFESVPLKVISQSNTVLILSQLKFILQQDTYISYSYASQISRLIIQWAYLFPIDSLEELKSGWNLSSRNWVSIEKPLQQALKIMNFRRQLQGVFR